ncbi:hypothetical protein Taro_013976 [Colocasia esculenta]|uniref:Uncharacterized protein n=1 Tax=Colocasia esculenta TaxID=4460 RepID=A0A843UHM8_COLES|nr:hypothetical protein [Colocasia esculenta]
MIRARAAGCSGCYAACVASVVARRVHIVAARLALDSLAVVFLVWRTLAGKSRCGAACVWRGLHRCRVVICGTGGRCPCLVGCTSVVGAEVHHLVALCSGGGFPKLFVVILVSVSLMTVPRSFLLLSCYLRV